MNKDSARTTAQMILDATTESVRLNIQTGIGISYFQDIPVADLQTIARAFLEGQEWVATSERLPEESGACLISRRHDLGCWAVNEAYFVLRKTAFVRPDGSEVFEDVEAFMSLPAPYRPEPEDEDQDSV